MNFTWRRFDESHVENIDLDLLCRCRVYDQLKETFQKNFCPNNDIEFSWCKFPDRSQLIPNKFSVTAEGRRIITSGYEVYNHILPAYPNKFYLRLGVQIIETPVLGRLAELNTLVKECKSAMNSDKKWRMLKDTEVR